MLKRAALSFAIIGTFLTYVVHQKIEENDAAKAVIIPSFPTSTSVATPTSQPTSKGLYKDGEYTGNVVDAFYGNVQVQVTISDGKITDVQFLQYPNDRRTSIEINTEAMPYLKQEAISAQNAQVDIVSGATQTSQAFIESLGSALAKAK